MIFEPETVKGFNDILPPDSLKYEAIKSLIETKYKSYGFLPIKTPIVEFDELMRSDSIQEDEAVSDRFKLKDKGGRNLALRYEFTFQLARILKQNPNLKMPFKRFQIGSVFRDEPTSTGRFREFTQCDADIVGDPTIEADAECIALGSDVLKELKINAEIKVNNRKLLNAIIDSIQISNKEAVMRELDKLDKIGEDEVKSNLKKYADSMQVLTLFKLLEKDLNFFVTNLFEGAEDIKKLEELGKDYGFKIKFTPNMVRGLSYYTGNIFEFVIPGKSSIAAGGRYDRSVGKFLNKEIPAVGISFGLERLMSEAQIDLNRTKVILISIGKDKQTIKLAQTLRKENISCVINFGKLGKGLEYADSYEIPYAIFIGKDEIDKKKFKLRNMKSGEEKLLAEKGLISALKKI